MSSSKGPRSPPQIPHQTCIHHGITIPRVLSTGEWFFFFPSAPASNHPRWPKTHKLRRSEHLSPFVSFQHEPSPKDRFSPVDPPNPQQKHLTARCEHRCEGTPSRTNRRSKGRFLGHLETRERADPVWVGGQGVTPTADGTSHTTLSM